MLASVVAGSSGAFFEVSDTIIQMKDYNPRNITAEAKKAVMDVANGEVRTDSEDFPQNKAGEQDSERMKIPKDNRIPYANKEVTESRKVKVRGSGTDSVSLNHESVEIRFVEQVVDNEQTNLLGAVLRKLEERYFNGKKPLTECVNELYSGLMARGFEAAAPQGQVPGNYAMVRIQELWAMVNRYRGLQVSQSRKQ